MYIEYKTIPHDISIYDNSDYIGKKLTEEAKQGWEYIDTIKRPGTYNDDSSNGNIYVLVILGRTKIAKTLYTKGK